MSDILAQFKALKLCGMASSYAELRQQNTPDVADSFNFADTLLNQLLQAELATMEFTAAAQNLVLVGGTGTGKTHLAIAIGTSGIQHHNKKVRFFSAIDLANSLEQEKSAGKQGRLALRLLQIDLVILDELGYLPFSQAGGALLFHLL